jgi:hypothetical protein
VRFFKTFAPAHGWAGATTAASAFRPPGGFASKPRARFDCLEIELLMSSHSNFSRLPLSKSRKGISEEPLFLLVVWSYRRMVVWSDH